MPMPGSEKSLRMTVPPTRSGNLQADHRDHGDHRVAQRVADRHAALRRPFAQAVRM